MSDTNTVEQVAAKAAEECWETKTTDFTKDGVCRNVAAIIARHFAGWSPGTLADPDTGNRWDIAWHPEHGPGMWCVNPDGTNRGFIPFATAEHLQQRLAQAEAERDAARERVRGMEAVIAKLPKTADGVPVTPGMLLYDPEGGHVEVCRISGADFYGPECPFAQWPGRYYSTREAARNALAGGEGKP